MPRYVYSCEGCGIIFQTVHSIKERLTDCEECDTKNVLKRIPTMPLVFSKDTNGQNQEVGILVKEYIEETKEELQQEKKELRNQVYKDD